MSDNMARSSKSGNAYELRQAVNLRKYKYNDHPVIVWGTGGSNKKSKDVDGFIEDGDFLVETKTKGAWEFGSSKFHYFGGKYTLPDEPLISKYLATDYQPFRSFVPSFLKGTPSNDILKKERKEQKAAGNPLDYKVPIPDRTLAAQYYRSKGVPYIQIQGSGLYRTGPDTRNWGLPLLEFDTAIRIRCKPHKTDVSYSVQAQIVSTSKPKPSPFDLDDPKRLPRGFSA